MRGGRTGIADLLGDLGGARVAQRADHLVAGRQAGARDAVGHHLGIAEDRRAGLQRGAGSRDEIRREHEMLRRLDQAAGMDHAHGDIGLVLGEAGKIGFRADDREGALVDRIAVPDIVARRASRCLPEFLREPRRPEPRSVVAASSPGFFSLPSSEATRPIAAAAPAFATSAIG